MRSAALRTVFFSGFCPIGIPPIGCTNDTTSSWGSGQLNLDLDQVRERKDDREPHKARCAGFSQNKHCMKQKKSQSLMSYFEFRGCNM